MPNNLTKTHIILFVATILTTITAGALQSGVNPLTHPELLYKGLPFSTTIMLILLTHEFGHYFASKFHHTPATLPYFLPAPPIPMIIGTFGAFIKIKAPIYDKRSLMDIGAAGPLAGFVVAVICTAIGLELSEIRAVIPSNHENQFIMLGDSLIFKFLTRVILSVDPSQEDITIFLHPVAFAGWIGLFITSFNLLPIGQLDGGHIAYALLDQRHSYLSIGLIPLLIVLGLSGWHGWILWSVIMLILGLKHPPVVNASIALDDKRKWIGVLSIIVFILTFIPEPFKLG
jgi:membrane-associated protease RseP (regulator of RpoE activity)